MPRHVFPIHRINNILTTFSGLARSSMGWLLQHHLLQPLLPFQHTLCSALLNFAQVLGYAMFSLAWGTACYSYSKGTEFNLDIIFFSRSFPSGLLPLLCSPVAGDTFYIPIIHLWQAIVIPDLLFCFAPIHLTLWRQELCLFCSLLVAPSPSRVLST